MCRPVVQQVHQTCRGRMTAQWVQQPATGASENALDADETSYFATGTNVTPGLRSARLNTASSRLQPAAMNPSALQ